MAHNDAFQLEHRRKLQSPEPLIAGKIIPSKSSTVLPRTVMRIVALGVTTFGAVPASVKMVPTIAPLGKVFFNSLTF